MDEQNADHTIQLLRVMLVMSPDDAETRFRLLSLLHTKGDAAAFVEEAQAFRMRHPEDYDNWERICAMGREVAPYDIGFSAGGFDSQSSGADAPSAGPAPGMERRQGDRRSGCDRRRTTDQHWPGQQRRQGERRRRIRRKVDLVLVQG